MLSSVLTVNAAPIARRAVAVVPVQVLLEQEEGGYPAGYPAVDAKVVAEQGHRLGQQVEQRPAEQ